MIEFTQYLRPDGRAKTVFFETTPDQAAVEADAKRLIAAGYRFECEELSTGDVSFTIVGETTAGEEGDVAIEVVPNGEAGTFVRARLDPGRNDDATNAALAQAIAGGAVEHIAFLVRPGLRIGGGE